MHGTQRLLELVRDENLAAGLLRGLFHIAIGCRITDAKGNVLATGVTWRELSTLLKDAKYDKELVRELGGEPDTLSPKDREKFWYSAIALARVDSPDARTQADRLAALLAPHGLIVTAAPSPAAKPFSRSVSTKLDQDETDEHPVLPPSPPPPPPAAKKRKK